MLFKKTLAVLAGAAVTIGSMAAPAMADSGRKIFIVGDSTACIYGSDDNYAVPRAGWGMYLESFVNNAEVVDLAISGRSSKSFTVEDEYKALLNDMEAGDYLIIQFGHNDAKKTKPEDLQNRYTDPEGDINTEGSFKNSLYKNYIAPAREKGVTPLLFTPIARRSFDEKGNVEDTHGIYDDDVRELGAELNVPVVDANKMTTELYNQLGFENTAALHAVYKDVKKGNNGHDDTHLNHYGAKVVAYGLAKLLKNVDGIGDLINVGNEVEMTVTRAEFTTEIVRLIGGEYKDNAKSCFPDVDVLSVDTTGISAAKDMGIVQGDEKGNFNPSKPVSLQEMCTITARALKAAGAELNTDTSVLDKMDKREELKPYAEESVSALLNLWGDAIPSFANPREIMDEGSVYTVYSLVYDELNTPDENAVPQSIDEVEKVE